MRFSKIDFIRLRKFTSILSSLSTSIMKRFWSLSNALLFVCFYQCDHVFFVISTNNIMYYIDSFQIFCYTCIPIYTSFGCGIQSFLDVAGFSLLLFVKNFYIYIYKISAVFMGCRFLKFWYPSDADLIE